MPPCWQIRPPRRRHCCCFLREGSAVKLSFARLNQEISGRDIVLIVGGALGNIIDRLRQGAVTDFLDLYWRNWHWPTFNGADIAITLGALLVFTVWLRPSKSKEPAF